MPRDTRNFFISYRRKAEADNSLAHFLHDGLKREKQNVFIDIEMTPGTNWVNEIGRRIDACDYLVVLLSGKSIHSEMVQGEVRRAHQRRNSNGTPVIVPVRVQYDGSLGYELDSYLSPVQYVRWDGPDDFERILHSLLGMARDELGSPTDDARRQAYEEASAALHLPRPLPAADPRILRAAMEDPRIGRPPGGSISPNDPFYIERPSDELVRRRATIPGDTLTIKASRQMGKSSLLVRYLMACRDCGKRPCLIDFQQFTNDDLQDYMIFLRRLYELILHYLGLDSEKEVVFKTQQQFSNHVEDNILKKITEPVSFAFDEVDRILGQPYHKDFFALLRSWHNKRADTQTKWHKADLALVIATDPYLLIKSEFQSPFNVSVPIELAPFTRADLDSVNQCYGSPLIPAVIDKIFALLAGHPYLTRLAFYRLVVVPAMSLDTLISTAVNSEGPFGDHLRSRLLLLQQQPELLDAMHNLAGKGKQPKESTAYLLKKAGLAAIRGSRLVPANELYEHYFRSLQ